MAQVYYYDKKQNLLVYMREPKFSTNIVVYNMRLVIIFNDILVSVQYDKRPNSLVFIKFGDEKCYESSNQKLNALMVKLNELFRQNIIAYEEIAEMLSIITKYVERLHASYAEFKDMFDIPLINTVKSSSN